MGDHPTMSDHANGARSCIARSLGGDEPDDFWYEQANQVLADLAKADFIVQKMPCDVTRQVYRQIGLFLEDGQRERLIVAQAILDPRGCSDE